MRAIRIIKQKRNANEATTESKKPDEASTQKIANTVKSWIEESQQHRRNLPRSLPALGVLILIACSVAMGQSSDIKVTIATTDGFLGPPATRYKVGEQIPVTITMTNTSKDAVYTCISSDVYQDVPTLKRDGKVVPYHTCDLRRSDGRIKQDQLRSCTVRNEPRIYMDEHG